MNDAARTLGAYIPQDRRHALAGGSDVRERQSGAAAFADLSGFTGLTERLAQRLGPLRGAEELGAWLRRIYEPLVAAVEQEGGTVLGFSGDAITCFFEDDDGSGAVRAADKMQNAIGRLADARAADGERIGVRLKVAIAVGDVRRFVVGDPKKRLWDVMAGSTLVRTAAMEQEAKPGDIIVDALTARGAGRDALEHRGDYLVIRRLPRTRPGVRDGSDVDALLVVGDEEPAEEDDVGDGVPAVPRVAPSGAESYEIGAVAGQDDRLWPDAATAEPWAAEVAREHVGVGAEELGDFRPAGAVFLSFGGIDWDEDPDAGTRLDLFVRAVQNELDTSGGTLVQITVGDKGSYLYAAFGAPRAQGDDAARAVASALRLVSLRGPEVGDVDGLRAGVAYGAMYTGAYGATSRLTYGVLGPKTNLAARLMKRAGVGEVLCEPEAARRSRRTILFSDLPSEPFKGISKPVPLHRAERVLAEHERGERPMFGRDTERFDVGGLLSRVQHGDGAYLRYDGEAGIGKSRLLSWIAESAAARGMTVLRGSALDGRGDAGYRLWRTPFRTLLNLPESSTPTQIQEAFEGTDFSGDEAAESAVRAIVAPAPDESTRDGAARREGVGRVALKLLDAELDRKPVVILLDDVHKSDERSLDLLGRLVPRMATAPLAIVAAGRPASGDVAEELHEHLPGPARHLLGLEPEASRMLIASTLGVPAMAVPYPVSTAIHERAAGVPALVEEIARDLMERDALRAERSMRGIGRGARGRKVAEAEVKVVFDEQALRDLEGGLDALLLARIDRLTASERTAMKTASVIGQTAEHQQLAHLLESDPAALDAALTPLEGPDMLEALEGAHRFQQSVLQESAYENLLFEQRRALHRRLSQWYLERLQAGEAVDPAKMAYHFFHATEGEDDPELVKPALASLEDLARRHDAAGMYSEALETLAQSDKVVPEGTDWDADRARIGLRRGSILERIGKRDEARHEYRLAAEAAKRGGAAALEAEARGGLATLALHYGEFDVAREQAEAARILADTTRDPAALGSASLTAARVAQAAGDRDEADRNARAAVEAWKHSDEPEQALPARILVGRIALTRQDDAEAKRWLEPALADAEAAGRPYLEALAGYQLGEIALNEGRLDDAETAFERSLEVFETYHAKAEQMLANRALARLALDSGRLVDADRRYLGALQNARDMKAERHLVAAAVGRAKVAWVRGHAEWVTGILEAAREHPSLDTETRRDVERILAEIEGKVGKEEMARMVTATRTVRVEDAIDAPTTVAGRARRGQVRRARR